MSWPATMRAEGRDTYPVSQMMSAFFNLAFRDDLGRHGDPAEHRRREVLGLPREPKVEQKEVTGSIRRWSGGVRTWVLGLPASRRSRQKK
ncbi:MAG: hypothetical protein R2789_11215 [Microthrixaceae bacterium]